MIEKITDQNLERYDSRLKEWCDRKFFEKGNYGKYQTTEEAGAITFYPAPNIPLEGKVKFSFKETMPAEGVKGPDNPSTITGTSSFNVGRVGKNLFLKITPSIDVQYNYTATSDSDGTWHLNGSGALFTAITDGSPAAASDLFSSVVLNTSKTYVLSCYLVSGQITGTFYIAVAGSSNVAVVAVPSSLGRTSISFSGSSLPNGKFHARINSGNDASATNAVIRFQLEEGSSATNWEPQIASENANYTISLNNTYYGGEIELATGVMTVTYAGVVYDGSENITQQPTDSNGFYQFDLPVPSYTSSMNTNVCTHLPTGGSNRNRCYVRPSGDTGLRIFVSEYSTVDAIETWLATQYANGTPVTVCYELVTPEIVQLSPVQIFALTQTDKYTPRLNTVYTDADSLQISYLKSPIRDEYEKTQAILSLGGNS